MTNPPCRLIALDMDGTLLRPDKTIHPDTARDIAAASAAGVHVVYCSGRPIAEIGPYFDQLPTMRYAVCASGAVVYDRAEDTILESRRISAECLNAMADTACKYRAMLHLLTERETIVDRRDVVRMDVFHMGAYQPLYMKFATHVDDIAEEARRQTRVGKANIYFRSQDDRGAGYEELRHLPLTFALAEAGSLEMTAPGVSKATGLQALIRRLGISIEQTAGIGDADNDRDMLAAVHISVAMGNAWEGIRRMCDFVTDDNDHNGVGKAIRRIVGI